MKRILFALLSLFLAVGVATTRAQTQPAPVAASPENAAAFLGDWNISADGNYGPATFALTLKVTEGKIVGQISSQAMSPSTISNISKAGPTLILRYVFDYNGSPVNALITLTPGENNAVNASLDFADGAAQMSGTATKATQKTN